MAEKQKKNKPTFFLYLPTKILLTFQKIVGVKLSKSIIRIKVMKELEFLLIFME